MWHVLDRFLLLHLYQSNKRSSNSRPLRILNKVTCQKLSKSAGQGPSHKLAPQYIDRQLVFLQVSPRHPSNNSLLERYRFDLHLHRPFSSQRKSKYQHINLSLKCKNGRMVVCPPPTMPCPSRTSTAYHRRLIEDHSPEFMSATTATQPSSLPPRSSTVDPCRARPTMPSSARLGSCKSCRTSDEMPSPPMGRRMWDSSAWLTSSSSLPDLSWLWILWQDRPCLIEFWTSITTPRIMLVFWPPASLRPWPSCTGITLSTAI
mmetsp:Transcript_1869/g.3118  ORF Transcript_1869/g.3118 Transcript_1869/m.3118 type:complete len:261 (-) Transcript_1869:269-1051(-)